MFLGMQDLEFAQIESLHPKFRFNFCPNFASILPNLSQILPNFPKSKQFLPKKIYCTR